jgi:hypothetical protein
VFVGARANTGSKNKEQKFLTALDDLAMNCLLPMLNKIL